jgi:hypothetical protein
MKLARLPYAPGILLDYYEDALGALGALCERPWHDRLQVVAGGAAAALWNAGGTLHSSELRFAPADCASGGVGGFDVFPGCPLTFRVAEALCPVPPVLDRAVLAADSDRPPPEASVAERLWRNQFEDTTRWQIESAFMPAFHFSLVAVTRSEIQAIDQHWSLHRIALSLPDGARDESLSREIGFARLNPRPPADIPWPANDVAAWSRQLAGALEEELAEEIAAVRSRQESSLARELNRIDDYFDSYARELGQRTHAHASEGAKARMAQRLDAARAEQGRHRADQTARHEIRVKPHFDGLLLVAEPAWRVNLKFERARRHQSASATFVPRSRKWVQPGVA